MRLVLLRALIAASLLVATFFGCDVARADPVYQSQTYACTHEAAATGSAQVVAASVANKQIYVCGFVFAGAGTTPTVTLFYAATGTSCAVSLGTVVLTLTLTAGSAIVDHQTYYAGLPPVPSGDDLCATTAGTGTEALVYYTQF
jgi:hypothetical protein